MIILGNETGAHCCRKTPTFEPSATSEAEAALSNYGSFPNSAPSQPIWAVAENYRFEPAFAEVFFAVFLLLFDKNIFNLALALQARKLMENIGDIMNIQVVVEGSMNSSNPYFSSSWRRKLYVSELPTTPIAVIHTECTSANAPFFP